MFSYVLEVLILGRHINDGIRTFMVSKHNNPISVHGQSRGDGADEYLQPAAIAIDHYKNLVSVFYDLEECGKKCSRSLIVRWFYYFYFQIYVLDTGNSRIKVLTSNLEFIRHIENPCMKGRACTGIGLFASSERDTDDWIAAVNWRSKFVTRYILLVSFYGRVIR